MVDVIVSAVDIGDAGCLSPRRAPQLGHVGLGKTGMVGNPDHRLLAFLPHRIGHDFEEMWIGDLFLVATDVYVGCQGEGLGHLFQYGLEFGHSLVCLHAMAHGPLEGSTVAGHVDLRNHDDTILPGVGFELATLLLRVVPSGLPGHRRVGCELWKSLHLEAPGLVFGEVPMKGVHLEVGQQADFFLEFVEGDIRPSRVVHVSSQFERRIVGDAHGLDHGLCIISLGQLLQGGHGTHNANRGYGSDGDAVGRHPESIGFIIITVEGIVGSSVHRRAELHTYHRLGVSCHGTSMVSKKRLQHQAMRGVVQLHVALKHESPHAQRLHLLGAGQKVRHTG